MTGFEFAFGLAKKSDGTFHNEGVVLGPRTFRFWDNAAASYRPRLPGSGGVNQ
jgi:hypothetical protein